MASHPSPFYRQRQSNKTLDPNTDTAKFLYTILRQLDLKNIDWNEVAGSLDITNGHAARMRWSRFRAQIEGLDNSYSRTGAKRANGARKSKGSDKKRKVSYSQPRTYEMLAPHGMTMDKGDEMKMEDIMHESERLGNNLRPERFQDETADQSITGNGVTVHHPTMSTIVATQPKAQKSFFPPLRPDSDRRQYAQATGNNQLSSNHRPTRQETHGYNPTGHHAANTWPYQYPTGSYAYPTYSPGTASNPYHATPNVYHNQHQYGSMYGNPYPPRYSYGPRYPTHPSQTRQPHTYTNGIGTAASTPHIDTTQQSRIPTPQVLPSNTPAPNKTDVQQHSLTADLHTRALPQSHVADLAFQASYPWPYSEESLSLFADQREEPFTSSAETKAADHITPSAASHLDVFSGIGRRSAFVSAELVDYNELKPAVVGENMSAVASEQCGSGTVSRAGVGGNVNVNGEKSVLVSEITSGSAAVGSTAGLDAEGAGREMLFKGVVIKDEPEG